MAAKPKISFSLGKAAPKKAAGLQKEPEKNPNVMVFKGFSDTGDMVVEEDPTAKLIIPVKAHAKKGNRIAEILKKRAAQTAAADMKKQETEDVKLEPGMQSEAVKALLRGSNVSTGLSGSGSISTAKVDVKNRDALPTASADQYENVAVEDFGAALLRGMGYDPKKHTVQPYMSKPVSALTAGIGAELPGQAGPSEAEKKRLEEERAALKRKREEDAAATRELGWGLNMLGSKRAKGGDAAAD